MDQLIRLWIHETFRVFGDRLINNKDKLLLLDFINGSVFRNFQVNFDEMFSDPK